jgi:hypothetical protein
VVQPQLSENLIRKTMEEKFYLVDDTDNEPIITVRQSPKEGYTLFIEVTREDSSGGHITLEEEEQLLGFLMGRKASRNEVTWESAMTNPRLMNAAAHSCEVYVKAPDGTIAAYPAGCAVALLSPAGSKEDEAGLVRVKVRRLLEGAGKACSNRHIDETVDAFWTTEHYVPTCTEHCLTYLGHRGMWEKFSEWFHAKHLRS